MTNPVRILKSSMAEYRKPRGLVTCAMLLALQVLLGLVAAIPIGDTLRISFGYIALSSTGMLFGPAAALMNGALADVIGFLIKPTGAYFPGFTVTGLVSGMIYGFMLYDRSVSVGRVLLTKLLIDVICNLLLNTLWLNIMYGKAFFVMLPGRLLKNAVQYPVDVLILYPLLRLVRRVYIR